MHTPMAFFRRMSELAAIGLRFENPRVQPSCRQLWMEHPKGLGAWREGKTWLISAKQWFRVFAKTRPKLGMGFAVLATS